MFRLIQFSDFSCYGGEFIVFFLYIFIFEILILHTCLILHVLNNMLRNHCAGCRPFSASLICLRFDTIGSTLALPTPHRDPSPPCTNRHNFFLLRGCPLSTRWQRRNWERPHQLPCWLCYYIKRSLQMIFCLLIPQFTFLRYSSYSKLYLISYYFLYFIK